MKIGYSLSRCIPDIVEGRVLLDQVALIVTNTAFPHDQGVQNMVDDMISYHSSQRDWSILEPDHCRRVIFELINSCRIYQPRLFGGYNKVIRFDTPVWYDLVPNNVNDHPLVLDAWQQYCVALALVGQDLK